VENALKTQVLTVAVALLGMLAIGANVYRLHYGVDVSDESFYVAMAYRFALGDRPFIDEFMVTQGAALLLYPALKLFVWIREGTEGIILYSRYLHLAFTVFICAIIFAALRRAVDWRIALLAGLACVVFVPFNIHSPGYNTLGSGLFTAALSVGFFAHSTGEKVAHVFFAGVFGSLAAIAYPPLALPCGVFLFCAVAVSADRRTFFLAWVAGAFAGGCWLLVPLYNAGLAQLRGDLALYMSVGAEGGGLYKLLAAGFHFLDWFPSPGIVPKLLLVVLLVGLKIRPAWARHALPFVPLLVMQQDPNYAALNYVRNYAFMAPLLFYFTQSQKHAQPLFWLVWVPSLIAGFATSWSSGNGAYNGGIGLSPGCLVTTVYLAMLMFSTGKGSRGYPQHAAEAPNLAHAAPAALTVCLLASYVLGPVYRDAPVAQLTAKMMSGPYAGIYTTENRKSYLDQLLSDVARFAREGRSILFFHDFPAGYLFTKLRPATNTVLLRSPGWVPQFNIQATLDYYKAFGIQPDIVFKINTLPLEKVYEVPYAETDPLFGLITGPRYRRVLDRDEYSVFVRAREID
jgi:hypothetical protein